MATAAGKPCRKYQWLSHHPDLVDDVASIPVELQVHAPWCTMVSQVAVLNGSKRHLTLPHTFCSAALPAGSRWTPAAFRRTCQLPMARCRKKTSSSTDRVSGMPFIRSPDSGLHACCYCGLFSPQDLNQLPAAPFFCLRAILRADVYQVHVRIHWAAVNRDHKAVSVSRNPPSTHWHIRAP